MRFAILLLALAATQPSRAEPLPSERELRLIQSISLPHVEGRIDHLAIDLGMHRLFVAALGNNTVEVIDLAAGRWIKSLPGFDEPQGVCFPRRSKLLFVANGGDGRCDILDAATDHVLRTVRWGSDADNVRDDPAARRVYVGYGEGALGIVDALSGDSLGSIALPGHPESFELEGSGGRIFVNVPSAGKVVVVDRMLGRVVASWPLGSHGANFPMALDETGHRLFVGCRRPGAVLTLDTRSGARLGEIATCGDVDDLFYDRVRGRLYASCGSGVLQILATRPGGLRRVAQIPTANGARTSLFVPAISRLYVAAPRRGSHPAEILVFAVLPPLGK
jgi:hypothetical protein